MAAEEEEVAAELEAVQAVYGDDCVVLDSYHPHLHLHINPRTADVTSQQFVEAVISIRAGSKYPNESPQINLIESKGLDEQRQKLLVTYIRDKASELSSCLMLVALCEEAVERLSLMNHPDGDCPLCLYSLVSEDDQNKNLPFMKLMSCFHCFHCECISRWWNWLQTEKKTNPSGSSSSTMHPARDNDFKEAGSGKTLALYKQKGKTNVKVCGICCFVSDLDLKEWHAFKTRVPLVLFCCIDYSINKKKTRN